MFFCISSYGQKVGPEEVLTRARHNQSITLSTGPVDGPAFFVDWGSGQIFNTPNLCLYRHMLTTVETLKYR